MVKFILILLVLSKGDILISFGSIAVFFLILLISGIRKTRKLNEENRKLMESINMGLQETTKDNYQDFTENHSYRTDK